MATETKSPAWTSISPLSFLNSSIGMYDSDFRPALTTTWLCSTRTTSAVMTSPARISARCSDSSNRAAKDSDIEIAVGTAGLKLMIPATGALLRGGSVGGLLLLRWGSAFGAHHHPAKQPLYLGSKACFSPHHCRTCATDCSTVWPELSSNRASS